MSCTIAANILSPLGNTAEENYRAVLDGHSRLCRYETLWDLPEPFVASLFTEEEKAALMCDGLTWFESLAYRSAREATDRACAADASFRPDNTRTVFILSTTKANVSKLAAAESHYAEPGEAALKIARRLDVKTSPIVVCNACISGLSAIILAHRLLQVGCYDHAIVCGADVQSDFIVSGFQSFKALSPEACKPFDMERLGLNLGEAAATVILSAHAVRGTTGRIEQGIVRNDAHHISAPKNKDGGLLRALEALHIDNSDDVAFINAHGTATMFNDQMEAAAIRDAGLNTIPVNALKGYYGHTMGAAGVLETILSLHALKEGKIIGTRGLEEVGVSGRLQLTATHGKTDKKRFVKMLCGFGGCNAAITASVGEEEAESYTLKEAKGLVSTHRVRLTPTTVTIDGTPLPVEVSDGKLLTWLYKNRIDDYPRYYKMDGLSRLGFVAAELLLQEEGAPRFEENDTRGIVLFNRTSSTATDRRYLASIADRNNYFPSPSIFVYTLPNIVTGEMAIRNLYHGETAFYVLPEKDAAQMRQVQEATLQDAGLTSLITGWIDYVDDNDFLAEMEIVGLEQKP